MFKTACLKVSLIGCLTCLVLISPNLTFASRMYIDPASKEVNPGDEFDIKIKLDTQGDQVNAFAAHLSYPADLLDIKSVSVGGDFLIEAQTDYGGGAINISRGNLWSKSGDFNLAQVKFVAKSPGIASLTFNSDSAAPSGNSDQDTLTQTSGAKFNIKGQLPSTSLTPKPSLTYTLTPILTPTGNPKTRCEDVETLIKLKSAQTLDQINNIKSGLDKTLFTLENYSVTQNKYQATRDSLNNAHNLRDQIDLSISDLKKAQQNFSCKNITPKTDLNNLKSKFSDIKKPLKDYKSNILDLTSKLK